MTMALNWFQQSRGYAGGWVMAQAKEYATQKRLGPKNPDELAAAQKRDYVRRGGSSIFDESCGSGYLPKTLESELAKRQLEVKLVKACPRCGNTVLAKAGNYRRCGPCGWDSKWADLQPNKVAVNGRVNCCLAF